MTVTFDDPSDDPTAAPDPAHDPAQSLFVRACRGERSHRLPVWFMRQAGRSLPEYRQARQGVAMLESCTRPELVAEITMQPVRRYGVDAAIFYSDIVVPLKAVGVDVDIKPGVGPVVASPIRSRADLDRLRPLTPDDVPFVSEAVRALVGMLGGVPLIGFAGAPFTLASYLVEGGPSRSHPRTKAMMLGEPQLWHELLSRVADISAAFLAAQVEAGASAVQLFDSWAGALTGVDYLQRVQPHSAAVLSRVSSVPRIHFGLGVSEFLCAFAEAGADVVGVDWRLPLDEAARRAPGKPLQGNLDPALLAAPWRVIEAEIERIVDEGRAAPAHVFNLGHGVLPETDPDVLARVVEKVHALGA